MNQKNNVMSKYNWQQAWELVKQGKTVKQDDIEFTDELVPWYVVQDLNFAGLSVPQNLINHEYDKIDYSDIPPLDELLADSSFKEVFQISVDNEVATWIHQSHIDYNIVINNFLKSLYQSINLVNSNKVSVQHGLI